MLGRSPVMQDVYKEIALAAASDASVMLCGESGTGKELAARAIHRYSSRADGPFVAVNLAGLPLQQADIELFGNVRGPFAGGENPRAGVLAQAHGGTLFLDEVADIRPATQVKLLRALEHGEVTPVGGSEAVRTNVRVISTTVHSLARRIDDGSFRHDLYFRLCALQIDIPALRMRPQDIAELAEHFTTLLAQPPGTPSVSLTPEALAELQRRPWRGNVRELRNAIDHALIMARGRALMPEHLPPPASAAAATIAGDKIDAEVATLVRQWAEQNVGDPRLVGQLYERLIAVVERPLLAAAMQQHKGQCAAAARLLGMHRTTLRKKLDDHGLGGGNANDG